MTPRVRVPALEAVVGVRIVARPDSIDRATWDPKTGTQVFRIATDEAFAWQPGAVVTVTVDDADAIVEPEHGFVAATLSREDVERIRAHVETPLPADLPALVQGKIAGVPAKLGLPRNGRAVLLVQVAYAADLRARLGW